jgi:xanthine/CO dehydrogenase XdhC/CoxF family maturation factor
MTHRFMEDLKLLSVLLPVPLAYLGVVGSRQRTSRLLAHLQDDQPALSTNALQKLYAPVGLDLGGSTPEAVALSILAEIQCRLTGRTPIHLRDRSLPIHG